MAIQVIMPKQGQSVESCIIVSWKKHAGDAVKAGDILCEVETDKATFEVESPAEGTLLAIFHEQGADVPVLAPIAAIGKPVRARPAWAGPRPRSARAPLQPRRRQRRPHPPRWQSGHDGGSRRPRVKRQDQGLPACKGTCRVTGCRPGRHPRDRPRRPHHRARRCGGSRVHCPRGPRGCGARAPAGCHGRRRGSRNKGRRHPQAHL